MIEGRDIFRRLTAETFETLPDRERANRFFNNCSLCGDARTGVCCGCTQSLSNLSREKRKTIYRHLHDLGDKQRAARLEKNFSVFPQQQKAQIPAPTEDNPGRVRLFDLHGLRKRLGLNQSSMAARLHLNQSAYARIEKGERPLPKSAKPYLGQLEGIGTAPCHKTG